MIFQHTWEKVLSGEKTVTSRLPKKGETAQIQSWFIKEPGEGLVMPFGKLKDWHQVLAVYTPNGRLKWAVGKTYAVQTGRNQKGVARIRILEMWREDVREITAESACEEGCHGLIDFWNLWRMMHDGEHIVVVVPSGQSIEDSYREALRPARAGEEYLRNLAKRYDAWRIRFELV